VNARIAVIVLAGIALVAVLAWLLVGGSTPAPEQEVAVPVTAVATPTPAPEERIVLFFPGADGLLHPELRPVPLPAETEARVRTIMAELLTGPASNLAPTVPYPAELRAVFVSGDGRAWVDITAPPEPLEGSHNELMLVYGIVNSILLNTPDLRAVQVLFEGHELDTLTGHLDTSRPLVLNKRLVAAS
jgi:germination protein M